MTGIGFGQANFGKPDSGISQNPANHLWFISRTESLGITEMGTRKPIFTTLVGTGTVSNLTIGGNSE